jgi:hypothetical protein
MDAIDESLLADLRAALLPDADPAVRRAGADACRALLAVLDPPATTARPVPPAEPPIAPTTNTTPTPGAPAPAAVLRTPVSAGPPPSQVLDMVIAHLRSKLPADHATAPASSGFRVPMIPMRRPGGS